VGTIEDFSSNESEGRLEMVERLRFAIVLYSAVLADPIRVDLPGLRRP
jgi:hypothetical protein